MASPRTTNKPQTRFSSPFLTGEDAFALGAKYTIPITELISSAVSVAKRRKNLPTRFSRVDLQGVPVRDMTRPSFAPRYRQNQGSSLAERVGSQKFSDAFQTSQENQFEIQNEQMRRNQEYQNANIENQEEMMNAQLGAREEMINANMRFNDYMFDRQRKQSALNVLNQGLRTDPTQIFASKEMRDQTKAQWMLRYPEKFSAEELQWAESVITPVKRKGGKTKFSYVP